MRFDRHRWLIASIAAIASIAHSRCSAQTTQPARAVLRIGINVGDMNRSLAFFTRVLDFKTESDFTDDTSSKRVAVLKLGEETVELTDFLSPGGNPVPGNSRSNDYWFQHLAIVVTDMERAYKRLMVHHVRAVSRTPQRLPDWNPSAGGIRAFYFNDPDNHVLEIIWFPPGKGDPKWQASKELFAGIDHTAIVVADTNRSVKFYRDLLGLRIVGAGENHGAEQERLNNVPGAHLRITTLRAVAGPGVELLEYLQPRDGRSFPQDRRDEDLLNWQTVVEFPQIPSPKAIRDPDGHTVLLVGR